MLSSPSFYMFGAFFPSWMLCLSLGIVAALLVRFIFIRSGLEDGMPFPLIVYTGLTIAVAAGLAFLTYGQ